MIRRFGIATSINILVIAVVILASGLLGISLLSKKYEAAKDQLVEQTVSVVQSSTALQLALYFQDESILSDQLDLFFKWPAISYVSFRDSYGNLILDRDRSTTDQYPSRVFSTLRKNVTAINVGVKEDYSDQKIKFMDVTIPVFTLTDTLITEKKSKNYNNALMNSNKKNSRMLVGYLHAGVNLSMINNIVLDYAKKMAVFFAVFIIIFMMVTMGITYLLLSPLSKIAVLAKEISEGKLDKHFSIKGSGEILKISAMLNIIIDELNTHKSRIDVDNKLLTLKVAERNKELWKRNEALNEAVSQVKKGEVRLRQLAYYDSLTSLPNRQLFIEQLELLMNVAKRENTMLALLFLDLDNFKRINDTLGHNVGDQLLKNVAERLSSCLRDSDLLAEFSDGDSGHNIAIFRLGGDEFTVVLNNIENVDNVGIVARRILNVMQEAFTVEGHELVVTPSIGIALAPEDASTVESLLKLADISMYHTKKMGRNSYAFYSKEMNVASVERLKIEADLRRAIEREELVLHYQPQVNSITGEIVGAEALIRWNHPEHGLLYPDEFISLAEELGLIVDLGSWVIYEACRESKKIQNFGLNLPKISVNVSSLQFTAEFSSLVKSILQETGLEPHALELELTEGVIMDNAEASIKSLFDLKDLGVSLSVDDFGTGFSSLSYLSKFPLDELKIDRSFILELGQADGQGDSLVAAIIAMGKSLNLRLVAEGVDTVDQLHFLNEKDVNIIQGYLFRKPLPIEELIFVLEDNPFPAQINKLNS